MNISRLILKVFSADVFFKIIIAVISLLIIRYMDIEDYSIYAIVITTLTLVSTMVSSAFNRIFIVEDFEEDGIKPSTFLMFQLLMICFIFIFFIPFSSLYEELFTLTIILVISQTFVMFIQTCYQRRMNFRLYYRVEFLRVFLFLLMVLYLILFDDITSQNAIFAQATTGVIVFFVFGFTLFSIRDFINFEGLKVVTKKMSSQQVRHLFMYYLLFSIFMNCDILLLGLFSDKSVVAEYAAGFRYYAIMQLALASINKVLFPYIQKEVDYSSIINVLANHRKSAKYFIVIVVVAIVSSTWLIPLIDGGKYPNSIVVFQILAVSSFVSFLYSPYINIVLKESYFFYILKLVIIILPIHILANVFIQRYFSDVAALVALLDLCMFGLYNYLVYRKSINILNKVEC